MVRLGLLLRPRLPLAGWVVTMVLTTGAAARADDTLTLVDGRQLVGASTRIATFDATSAANTSEGGSKPIILVDDELRRTYVRRLAIREVLAGKAGRANIRISIKQPRIAQNSDRLGSIGGIINIAEWDEFGRRIFSMKADNTAGRLDVIQGITMITPTWTKAEALRPAEGAYIGWDMRIATSSIPPEILRKIIARHVDQNKVDSRLQVVTLYLQAGRYQDALTELNAILELPGAAQLPDLNQTRDSIRQLGARRILDELDMRRSAGQFVLADAMLNVFPKHFPPDQVAGAITGRCEQMKTEMQRDLHRVEAFKKTFDDLLAKFDDSNLRPEIEKVREEMFAELGPNTLGRTAAFRGFAGDEKMTPGQKLALAVSGWLVGSDAATDKIKLALSLHAIRNHVVEYLNEPQQLDRTTLLVKIRSLEGASVENVAKLVAHLKPPVETKPQNYPGFYRLAVQGIEGEPPVTYYVQLPPEYDPHRRYPAVVTLRPTSTSTVAQVDWWAGSMNKDSGKRAGQASRHGTIVIAPAWLRHGQVQYEYSAREHAAVLASLRDALRRFSIDTDRVFLSGHSIGGDAAWDIALAHPDLWAGVIPIVARADRYVERYWKNSKFVPMYFICGELDGNRMSDNSKQFDRYCSMTAGGGCDVTIVEYRGRGHEHFHEAIQDIFDWMGRRRRNFYQKNFEVSSMRSWDNFFWWVEVSNFPPNTVAAPQNWPPKGKRPLQVEAKIMPNNFLRVQTAANQATIWLAPELVDFNETVRLSYSGNHRVDPEPDLLVLLDDVRTRGDRQHPFWDRIDIPEHKQVQIPLGRLRAQPAHADRRQLR